MIGGHEHFLITATENRTLISKAGSDAKTRGAHRRQPDTPNGTVERFYELLPITGAIPDDPRTAAVIKSYESRLGAGARRGRRHHARAARRHQPATCAPRKPTSAMWSPTRCAPMRAADIAIVNSGSIRGNRIYPRRAAHAAAR